MNSYPRPGNLLQFCQSAHVVYMIVSEDYKVHFFKRTTDMVNKVSNSGYSFTQPGIDNSQLVFNDNDYGLISWKQTGHSGRTFGTGLTNPDFKKYAESFGIKGYAPKTLKDLKRDLKEAITGQQLCLVEIPIQPAVNYELSQKLKEGHFDPFNS